MVKVIQDTKDMIRDRIFLRKALLIALPVALQGMLNTIVNLVDTLMIGQLGETTIAAVGLANKVFFVFSLLVFGVVSGSGVLAAQYWGNQDVKNIRKVTGLALLIALTGSILFVVPLWGFSPIAREPFRWGRPIWLWQLCLILLRPLPILM